MLCRAFILLICIASMIVACAPTSQPSLEQYRLSSQQVDNGTLYLRGGDLNRARAAFKVSAELAPSAAAYDGLGCVAFLEGRYEEAEQLYWKAYNMDSSYDHVLGNLALLFEVTGQVEKARRFYAAALKRNPTIYQFRNNFAAHIWDYDVSANRLRRALGELRKAAALSKDQVVRDNVVRLERMEKHEQARF